MTIEIRIPEPSSWSVEWERTAVFVARAYFGKARLTSGTEYERVNNAAKSVLDSVRRFRNELNAFRCSEELQKILQSAIKQQIRSGVKERDAGIQLLGVLATALIDHAVGIHLQDRLDFASGNQKPISDDARRISGADSAKS